MADTPAACPVATTTRLIGGRWKARLIWALFQGEPRRFSELRRACPPISDRILSKELRELEAAGLIARREQPGPVAQIDYRLTEDGRTLEAVMAVMAGWGSGRSQAGGGL